MGFHVGQKIVCVRDDWDLDIAGCFRPFIVTAPRKGRLYHVRSVDRGSERTYIRVAEIVNPEPPGRGEVEWWIEHFRPVIERKTDISIFTAMLRPNRVEERTNA